MLDIDHYQWAVIRLAVLRSPEQPGRLLFATVSLLSPNRPAPVQMIGAQTCKVGKSGNVLMFRRTVLSAEAAIEWYRSLGSGKDKVPLPSRTEDIEPHDHSPMVTSQFIDDPVWPHLGLPMGEGLLSHPTAYSHPAPFIGSVPSRVHRRFGNAEGFQALLTDDNAVGFIARRLHINLKHYPEYLGSVALIAPNPLIKQIDNFMIPGTADKGESILYRFIPRAGKTLKGLQITTFDEQARLLTSFQMQDIPADGILEIEKGSCLGRYGFVVTHPKLGPLVQRPPASFLRTMNFSVNAVGATPKVRVPISSSPNAKSMEYAAAAQSDVASRSVFGDEPGPNVNERIGAAAARRDKVEKAQHYGQRWFANNSRVEAMRFVQEQIGRARSKIIIADPYLADLQLGQFLYAANASGVQIIVLTSTQAFKADNKSKNNGLAKVTSFNEQREELTKNVKINVEPYVLSPKTLHDRFLVIDDAVWFLGNSLNALGDKASMIVKLPDPVEVVERLEAMVKEATPFASYLKKRRRETARPAK